MIKLTNTHFLGKVSYRMETDFFCSALPVTGGINENSLMNELLCVDFMETELRQIFLSNRRYFFFDPEILHNTNPAFRHIHK